MISNLVRNKAGVSWSPLASSGDFAIAQRDTEGVS